MRFLENVIRSNDTFWRQHQAVGMLFFSRDRENYRNSSQIQGKPWRKPVTVCKKIWDGQRFTKHTARATMDRSKYFDVFERWWSRGVKRWLRCSPTYCLCHKKLLKVLILLWTNGKKDHLSQLNPFKFELITLQNANKTEGHEYLCKTLNRKMTKVGRLL